VSFWAHILEIGLMRKSIIFPELLRWSAQLCNRLTSSVIASNDADWTCSMFKVTGRNAFLCATFGIAANIMIGAKAEAQDAEPRLYTNTPVDLNFLIAGYVYSQGKLAFDPSLSIADAQFHTHTGAAAYVRSFDLWGQSAKFDLIVPYSAFSAHGLVAGQPREREMSGLGDPRFRVSVNLLGAPALSVREFASYKQDLIIGVSLQVSTPLGQYDDTKLLNLGNNRWSFRSELGISKMGAVDGGSSAKRNIFH